MSEKTVTVNDRDFEVLGELEFAVRNFREVAGTEWVRPLDCGGSNGSHHSYCLAKLVRAGFAQSRQRSAFGRRGSKKYTITDAGLSALAARKAR